MRGTKSATRSKTRMNVEDTSKMQKGHGATKIENKNGRIGILTQSHALTTMLILALEALLQGIHSN